jgi:hypothetical protein
MAVQACEQSEQGQACGECKMPDMFLEHNHAKSPDRTIDRGILVTAAAAGARRREMVFSFLR